MLKILPLIATGCALGLLVLLQVRLLQRDAAGRPLPSWLPQVCAGAVAVALLLLMLRFALL